MRYILYLLFLVLLSNIALGATIHGNVYSYELNLNKNSIVSVNSTPRQTIVAKDGIYSFKLDLGTYDIIAFERINNITLSSTKETITIAKNGDYIVDLILFPLLEEEEISDLNLEDVYKEKTDYTWYIIAISLAAIAIILAILSVVYYKRFLKRKKGLIEEHEEKTETAEDLADKVLEFIKSEQGRTTQKDIRKRFTMSEAKISLVISELEHKGKIEKIKKGRGNIIVLKK